MLTFSPRAASLLGTVASPLCTSLGLDPGGATSGVGGGGGGGGRPFGLIIVILFD